MDFYLRQIFFELLPATPWLLGGLSGLAIVSFSPLGKALALRVRRGKDVPGAEALAEETSALRGELGEVLERFDFLERAPVADRAATGGAMLPGAAGSGEGPATPS